MNFLEVRNLNKFYGDIHAVKDVSFNVKKGAFFAFLGPNGAGKSTTINIITTLLSKNTGEIILDGYDIEKNDLVIFYPPINTPYDLKILNHLMFFTMNTI